jgi:hypothetical protein
MLLGNGLPSASRVQLDSSIAWLLARPLRGRRWPGHRVVADELVSMPPWPTRLGLRGGIGIAAAARTQAHREADGPVGQGKAELDGIRPGVTGTNGRRRG